ncbi:ComF family protein [Collimonas pratensis]|uniref:ComF family protein n=1 Tax=Collimonas pratensis TaxID=279113 RepID=UPI001F3EC5A6|nr:ComF family protein [Collimonas pratensis]
MLFPRLRLWPRQQLARILRGMPSCCALCGQEGQHVICGGCSKHYFASRPQRCVQCANPLPRSGGVGLLQCGNCLKQSRAFDATIVVCDYAAPVDQLIQALKFRSQLALAPVFAKMLRDAVLLQAAGKKAELPDILMAVPLSAQRLQQRGFNQAHEIAKPLARLIGIPLRRDLLLRQRDTLPQSMGLDLEQRRRNLRQAFAMAPAASAKIDGRHIGVVDDVMTTGETLHALAKTLRRHGARRITNFVFARTP